MNRHPRGLPGWREVGATTVQRGDVVKLHGFDYTVANMLTIYGNRKRLIFAEGGAYTLGESETLPAYRDPW